MERYSRDGRKRSRSRSASRGDDDRRSKDRKRSKGSRHHSRERSSSKRHKKDKHRHGRRYDDSDDSVSYSSSSSRSSDGDDRNRKHSKKRHRKDKKKKHKKKKDKKHSSKKEKKHRHSRSRSSSPSPPAAVAAPPGAHELASALTQLFDSYPAMASIEEGGIPLIFIQLSRGTEYNLQQMPDRNLARLLEVVFEALSIHGMELGGNGAWNWGNAPKGGRAGGDDLALLRLSRALLNGVGFTMDTVEKYEQDQLQKLERLQQQATREQEALKMEKDIRQNEVAIDNANEAQENENDVRHRKRVERMTSQMLDRFDPKNTSSSASSLANELQGICDVLVEGESIQLDGIENTKLKATLAQLFQLIGLDLVEMEEDEEDGGEESDNNQEKIMGYALPDVSGIRDTVTSNLNEVLRVCRFRSSGGSEDAPKAWAANPAMQATNGGDHEESSSDDDDGPAPLGTLAAAKAAKRKRPPQERKSNNGMPGGVDEGGREEWMMVPGEHDFLKGISKSTRSRTFKNEKNRGQPIAPTGKSEGPINPQVLEEVNAIQKAYEQSRGPSLLDAHRQKQQETKLQQEGQKKEWKWSRDKNLDDGRRVDKNALHQVLGGASTELKSKFQGSLGR